MEPSTGESLPSLIPTSLDRRPTAGPSTAVSSPSYDKNCSTVPEGEDESEGEGKGGLPSTDPLLGCALTPTLTLASPPTPLATALAASAPADSP